MVSGDPRSPGRPSYRLAGVKSASRFVVPDRRRTSVRGLASAMFLTVGVVLSGCGGNDNGTAPPSQPSNLSTSASSTSTESARSPQREGFDDALARAGMGNLPMPVSDTLATLASHVCAAGGGESQKSDRISDIMPVAESVASLTPGTDARQVANTVYDAGLENYCS